MQLYHIGSKEELKQLLIEILSEIIPQAAVLNQTTEMITREEAAAFLKISLPTLDTLTKKQILIGTRCGKKILYKKEELLKNASTVQSLRYKQSVFTV